ncbi:hypothetical protein TURU_000860 [Turdus rufiventris]|nr:hypothetical protein TURU_000860 [Turdus rufiventris]
MRQRRRKARPIRAKEGASVANPGQLCLCPGIGTPQVGLSCPKLAVTTHCSQLEKTWKILMIVILPSIFSEQRINETITSHAPCGKIMKLLQLTCTQN